MADPKHLFKFAFRFEARDHERVDAWLHFGDDLVLGPLHLSEAQSHQMGSLMEQAVIAMAQASDDERQTGKRAIPARLRASEPLESHTQIGTVANHNALPHRPTRCSTGTDERRSGRGRRK